VRLLTLRVDEIRPDPRTPRRTFDDDALDQLAESIKCWGQLQPIVVRRAAEGYQLICGERRWRAHQRGGLESIMAIERDATDQGALALALVENLHRVDLSHAEKVAGLDQLAELAHAQGLRRTALQLRMDPGWLSRQLAVHRDPVVFPSLEAGDIGFGQAAELCRAPEGARQTLLDRIAAAPAPVSFARVRGWVEQERRAAGSSRKRTRQRLVQQDPEQSEQAAYADVLDRLQALGGPRTEAGRQSLQRVLARVQEMLMEDCAASTHARLPPRKQSLIELACLLCGERAATLVDGTVLPARQGSVLRRGSGLVCGRCGGTLASDTRVDQYVYNPPRTAQLAALSSGAFSA
jgi:hypothetical protein